MALKNIGAALNFAFEGDSVWLVGDLVRCDKGLESNVGTDFAGAYRNGDPSQLLLVVVFVNASLLHFDFEAGGC